MKRKFLILVVALIYVQVLYSQKVCNLNLIFGRWAMVGYLWGEHTNIDSLRTIFKDSKTKFEITFFPDSRYVLAPQQENSKKENGYFALSQNNCQIAHCQCVKRRNRVYCKKAKRVWKVLHCDSDILVYYDINHPKNPVTGVLLRQE